MKKCKLLLCGGWSANYKKVCYFKIVMIFNYLKGLVII